MKKDKATVQTSLRIPDILAMSERLGAESEAAAAMNGGLTQTQTPWIEWDTKGLAGESIQIEEIDTFDARGKRCVYGRGDHMRRSFHMDVWLSRNAKLFARFWSRSNDVRCCSYVISGMPIARLKQEGISDPVNEIWVPEQLRVEYENWVRSEY